MTDAANLLDVAAVEAYLSKVLPGFHGPVSAAKTPVGQSNPTYLLSTPSGGYVLRRKPPGKLLKSAHAVDREYRVMTALAGSDVPVPKTFHLCEDPAVIGAVFFVMERVEGRNFITPDCPGLDVDARAAVFDDMNRCLAALHSVDYKAVGLGDFGRPGSYFERQFTRWRQQYRASETGTIADMDRLIDWLAENMPPDDGQVSLVHGDYRIDNLIYAPDAPQIKAVLDWELSTLGHPFADLGYQLMQWRLPPGEEGRGLAGIDRRALGIPSDEEYVERYCQRRELTETPDYTFLLAFCFFRMAAIVQGVKKRGLDGNASNPDRAARMGRYVPVYAQKACALIEEAGG